MPYSSSLTDEEWRILEPPYSTVYWHYKQWRSQGSLDKLMSILHAQVREQVKKNPSGQRC